jgi:exonuclease III
MDNTNLKECLLAEFGGVEENDLMVLTNTNELDENEPRFLQASSYIDMDTILEYVNTNKNNFSIMSVNIECINTKFEELLTTIAFLKESKHFSFSVICLQECWLQDDTEEDVTQFQIPGYKLLAQKQQCSKKGGLMCYVHEEFTPKDTKKFNHSPKRLWEAQSITITGKRLTNKINIINTYRPPRNNNDNETVADFLNEFEPYITRQTKEKAHTIYLGDFNINLLNLHQREKYQDYLDRFTSTGLIPRITLPTRFATKGCSLIDQIFCKFVDPLHNYNSAVLATRISDHFPCLISFDIKPKNNVRPKYVDIKSMSDTNMKAFEQGVTNNIYTKNRAHPRWPPWKLAHDFSSKVVILCEL